MQKAHHLPCTRVKNGQPAVNAVRISPGAVGLYSEWM